MGEAVRHSGARQAARAPRAVPRLSVRWRCALSPADRGGAGNGLARARRPAACQACQCHGHLAPCGAPGGAWWRAGVAPIWRAPRRGAARRAHTSQKWPPRL